MTTWLSPLAPPGPSCVVHELGNGIARVVPSGRPGPADGRRLRRAIASVGAEATLIVVDLRGVTSVDEKLKRVLDQATAEEAREGRRVVLANRPPEPGRTG